MKFTALIPALALLIGLCNISFAQSAKAFPVGKFRVMDAYCTNPNYKYSKEEQDYRDSLKGIGSCKDGKMQSHLCFEDYYDFHSATRGTMIVIAKDRPGVQCTMVTPLEISEPQPGVVQFKLGPTTSHGQSNDAGTSISCGSKGESSDDKIQYQYKMQGSYLLLKAGFSQACGDFIFEARPVTAIPR